MPGNGFRHGRLIEFSYIEFSKDAAISDAYQKLIQDFRFSSFPRMRESSHSLKRVDTRLRGYDEIYGFGESPVIETLRTGFEMDKADLDFGIYRILNQKLEEITRFLEKDSSCKFSCDGDGLQRGLEHRLHPTL